MIRTYIDRAVARLRETARDALEDERGDVPGLGAHHTDDGRARRRDLGARRTRARRAVRAGDLARLRFLTPCAPSGPAAARSSTTAGRARSSSCSSARCSRSSPSESCSSGLSIYVRNVVHDAAVEGAFHAALADTSLRTARTGPGEIISRTVGTEYAADIDARETKRPGPPTVEVTVRATLPLVGLLGAARFDGGDGACTRRILRLTPPATTPERGSAALEFILVGLILLVPLVYLVVSLGLIQGQSLGAEAGARHIARAVSQALGCCIRSHCLPRTACSHPSSTSTGSTRRRWMSEWDACRRPRVSAGGSDHRDHGSDAGGAAARAAGARVSIDSRAFRSRRPSARRSRDSGEPDDALPGATTRGASSCSRSATPCSRSPSFSCASMRRACTSRRSAWIHWRMLPPSPAADGFTLVVRDDEPVAVLGDDGVHDQAEAIVVGRRRGCGAGLGGDAGRRLGARDRRGHLASAVC